MVLLDPDTKRRRRTSTAMIHRRPNGSQSGAVQAPGPSFGDSGGRGSGPAYSGFRRSGLIKLEVGESGKTKQWATADVNQLRSCVLLPLHDGVMNLACSSDGTLIANADSYWE